MVTKADIAVVLKGKGLSFVKLSSGSYMHNTSKCYTDGAGKRVRGIYAACYGPLTVTNAHNEQTDTLMNELVAALKEIGMVEEDGVLVAPGKKSIRLALRTEWFPAYTRAANLDSGYQNIFIVPTYQ